MKLSMLYEEKPIYVGAFLESKEVLLNHLMMQGFKLKDGWITHAGHCTMLFRPDQNYLMMVPIGEIVDLKIVGYAEDEKGQAVVVEPPSNFKSFFKNPISHITIATAPGISPVYSNELLKKGWGRMTPIVVSATIDTFPRVSAPSNALNKAEWR